MLDPKMDDDDRAYNAAVEMDEGNAWYPDWKGPDEGALQEWNDHLLSTGEGSQAPEDADFLPEFNEEDLPF